jgi:potassium-transporting ATPase KdpC subunit
VLGIISPALRVSLVTWLLCGIAYPLAVTGLGQWLLPFQANGSPVRSADGTLLGSRLIGQDWSGPQWFHGRPSATTAADPDDPSKLVSAPYNAAASGGSNLGPTSRQLADRLMNERRAVSTAQPELAGRRLPADTLTTSASGLDPDISPADAALQVPRVAAARGLAMNEVAALVARNTVGRALGIFGEPRVNVLQLNLDLRDTYPVAASGG